MSILARYMKQPVEVMDYDINFTNWLANKQDTIQSVVGEISPAGLTLDDTTFNQGFVKVFVSGGSTGTNYKVSVTVTTVGGRIKQAEILVKVKED